MSEENNTLNPDELEKVTGGQRSAYHYFWDRVEPLIIKYGLSKGMYSGGMGAGIRRSKLCT